MNQRKWYEFYNNNNQPKNKVLIQSEFILDTDLIVAKKIGPKTFQFSKFNNISQFINCYNNTVTINQTYYAVLTNSLRYLYFDVDYKTFVRLEGSKKCKLICEIQNLLNEFNNYYHMKFNIKKNINNWLIWDGTRNNKFSLHLINTDIILNYKMQYDYCVKINNWIKKNNKLQ